MTEPELGVVVTSRAGHDKGRAFIIVGRDGSEHVLLCDGKTRTVEKPKRKKLKHLHMEPYTAEEIADQLKRAVQPQNADIRKALAACGYNTQTLR